MPDRRLDRDEVDEYLARIGAARPQVADARTLAELHRRHLLTVPFENLDIHTGGYNVLELDAIFDKVVRRRRGGWCFELNSLFAALLRALGFDVSLLAARVARHDGAFGQPFEHLALRVDVADEPASLLADVGFGEAFMTPVPIVGDDVHEDDPCRIRLSTGIDGWVYEDDRDGRWVPRYTFGESSHQLEEYAAMNAWLQTSPESHFTQQRICSLATDRGRVTLSDERLIERIDGVRTDGVADDPAAVLRERFGVVIDRRT